MHKSMQTWSRGFITPNVRMGKKCDLSDFDCGKIIGGLSISETAYLVTFPREGMPESRHAEYAGTVVLHSRAV